MNDIKSDQTCPYCKEAVKADAIKCRFCGSPIFATKPSHEGTCPYCKETIKKDAIKCSHCKSNLIETMNDSEYGLKGDGCNKQALPASMAMARQAPDGFGPDTDFRNCEVDCTMDFVDCMTTTTNRGSRTYCLGQLRWCSLFCKLGSNFGGFGGSMGI